MPTLSLFIDIFFTNNFECLFLFQFAHYFLISVLYVSYLTISQVAKSWTRLSDFTLIFHFHALEKEMATHSSVLAWRIPGTGEPGGLPSMGLHRVGHD